MTYGNIRLDYADVGGLRLHYATEGTGERLVVLLHGFPEFWYSWRHQIAALSNEFTVVAPDMRGFNLSDKPRKISDYELGKVVEDITGLIRHLGREKAAVIGHDWGASVAWVLAKRHPECLWALGALQVPPIAIWRRNQNIRQILASWYIFFFQLPYLPEFVLKFRDYKELAKALTESIAERGVFGDEEIAKYIEAWKQPFAITSMLNYYRANILRRYIGPKAKPHKITVPTIFIYGVKDKAVLPATVSGVGDIIDAPFREVRIPESGHWVQQEAADEVSSKLLEFLIEHS